MITDYTTLQSAITDYLARSDLSTVVTTFISQAEARIYRELRVAAMEQIATPTVASGAFPVPADYLEMRNLYVTDAAGAYLFELERMSPFQLRSNYQIQSSQGQPRYYAREAQNFILGPYPDASYPVSMLYFARLPSLGTSNTTNWLTSANPDLIFAASMLEAGTYMNDAQAVPYWEQRYQSIAQQVQQMDRRERTSGSPPVMRPG